MCNCVKNRDADHAYYDMTFDSGNYIKEAQEFIDGLEGHEIIPVPSYTFDVHTSTGRRKGKTKFDFLIDEQIGLAPARQRNLFDDVPRKLHPGKAC